MRTLLSRALIGALLLAGLTARLVYAQATGAAAPAVDLQKFEDDAKKLVEQTQKPDFDLQQFGQQMGDMMRRFQDATKDLPPEQADQVRQQLMSRLQPMMIVNMPFMMARMQTGYLNTLKRNLECTDDEFEALRPLIEKVTSMMRDLGLDGSARRGRSGRAGRRRAGHPEAGEAGSRSGSPSRARHPTFRRRPSR